MGVRNNRVLLDGHVAGLGQDNSRYLRGTLREQGSDGGAVATLGAWMVWIPFEGLRCVDGGRLGVCEIHARSVNGGQ